MISGDQYGNFVAECEIYDPATGTWTQTGSVNYARNGEGAVLLPDGRVFIAGGNDAANNPVLQSEIYDPATGTWTVDASLNTGRVSEASLGLLSNGKIIITGG